MTGRYVILALVGMAGVPVATAAPIDAEAAIRETIARYQDGVRAQSADDTVRGFASDAVFMPNDAPPAVGREDIRALFENVYVEGSVRGFTMTVLEVAVRGEWAFARTANTGQFKTEDGWQEVDTKSLFLLTRTEQGIWKIDRYMWNRNHP